MKTTCISLLAASLMVLGACKKNDDKKKAPAEDDPSAGRVIKNEKAKKAQPTPLAEIPGPKNHDSSGIDYSFLASVPADSPFLMAGLQPMSDGFSTYIENGIAPLKGLMQMGMSEARKEADDPMEKALLDELDGKLNAEGMASLGITLKPRFAMYAIGWSLALRIELADGAKFEAMIDRIEKKVGKPLPRAEHSGVSYREFIEEDAAFAIAIIDNLLVAGVMHKNARDKVLPVLFGKQKPAKSMADAGTARTLIDKYKLMGMGVWFFDTKALAAMLTGQVSGLSKEIMDATALDMPELSQVCKDEFMQMAGVMPRMVFGYQSASAKGYETLMSLELRADVASELSSLQTPGLDLEQLSKGRPVMAIGGAMELDKGMAWLRKKSAEMAAQPYKCEHLAELNEGIVEAANALKMPLPKEVAGAHGLAVVVKDIQTDGPMPSGQGFVALGVGNPMALVERAMKEDPKLAKIKIEPNKLVTVPIGMPGMDSASVLVKDKWIGGAIGSSMTETMKSFLESKSGSQSTFLTMAYDYVALMQIGQALNPDENPMEAQMMINMMAKLMGYNEFSLYFTKDGILGRTRTTVQ